MGWRCGLLLAAHERQSCGLGQGARAEDICARTEAEGRIEEEEEYVD